MAEAFKAFAGGFMVSDILNALKVLYKVGKMAQNVILAYQKAEAWGVMFQAVIDAEPDFGKKERLIAIKDNVTMAIFSNIMNQTVKGILQTLKTTDIPSADLDAVKKAKELLGEGLKEIDNYRHRADQKLFEAECEKLYNTFSIEYENIKPKIKDQSYSKGYGSTDLLVSDDDMADYALHEKLMGNDETYEDTLKVEFNQTMKEREIESSYGMSGKDSVRWNRDKYRKNMKAYAEGAGRTAIGGTRPTWIKLDGHRILLTRPVMEERWKQYNEIRMAAPLMAASLVNTSQLLAVDTKTLISNMKEDQSYFESVNNAWEEYREDDVMIIQREEDDKITDPFGKKISPPGNGLSVYKLVLMMALCVKNQFENQDRGKEVRGADEYWLASLASYEDFMEMNEDELVNNPVLKKLGITKEDVREAKKSTVITPTVFANIRKDADEFATQRNDHKETRSMLKDQNVQAYFNTEEAYLIQTFLQAAQALTRERNLSIRAELLRKASGLGQQLLRLQANKEWPNSRLAKPLSITIKTALPNIEWTEALNDSLKEIEFRMGGKSQDRREAQQAITAQQVLLNIEDCHLALSIISKNFSNVTKEYPTRNRKELSMIEKEILSALARNIKKFGSTNTFQMVKIERLARAAKTVDMLHTLEVVNDTVEMLQKQIYEIENRQDAIENKDSAEFEKLEKQRLALTEPYTEALEYQAQLEEEMAELNMSRESLIVAAGRDIAACEEYIDSKLSDEFKIMFEGEANLDYSSDGSTHSSNASKSSAEGTRKPVRHFRREHDPSWIQQNKINLSVDVPPNTRTGVTPKSSGSPKSPKKQPQSPGTDKNNPF